MSDLSPITPTGVPTSTFPWRLKPYNNITPVTYRDGETLIEMYRNLRHWLFKELVPYLDDTVTDYVVAFNEALGQVEAAFDDVKVYVTDAKAYVDASKTVIDAKVAAFNASVIIAQNAMTAVLAQANAAADRAASEADESERWAGQSQVNQDVNVSTLLRLRTSATYNAMVNRFGVYVDDFGAVADGVTDDTAAIQAAADAVAARGGGSIYFSPGKTYGLVGTVTLGTKTTIEGNGATIQKLFTGAQTSTSFVNAVAENAKGYGSGGRDFVFRNLRVLGNYNAGGTLDLSMAFLHVDGITFDNVTFEQGNMNAHYVDLGGCRQVRFNAACKFIGANPTVGREYVEAIQIDQATFAGAGWKQWPVSAMDGLPTRNVTVDGATFKSLTIGSVDYPCPNPIGSHGAAMLGDAGYYEDIKFINNHVSGWTKIIAAGSGLAYGWVHMRGVRGFAIDNNTFKYTGPTGISAISAVINMVPTTSAIADADVQQATPASTALATPRYSRDGSIKGNKFYGFANGPTSEDYGLISVTSPVDVDIDGNKTDGANSTVVKSTSSGTADGPSIRGNIIRSNGVQPAIVENNSTGGKIDDNKITLPDSTGVGIRSLNSNGTRINNNTVYRGVTGVAVESATNVAVTNTTGLSQSGYTVLVGSGLASGDNSFDTQVHGNKSRSTIPGSVGLGIGSKASRTRPYGNHWSSPTAVSDSGTDTVVNAYQDNA